MRALRCTGAVVGALTLALLGSSGAAEASDPAPNTTWVKVCHRTSSQVKPYVLITVNKFSTEFLAHLEHRHHFNRLGRRDYIDGLDGTIRTIFDCPEYDIILRGLHRRSRRPRLVVFERHRRFFWKRYSNGSYGRVAYYTHNAHNIHNTLPSVISPGIARQLAGRGGRPCRAISAAAAAAARC